MTEEKIFVCDAIDFKKNLIFDVSNKIWEYAELSLQEFKSAKLYCDILKREGFKVTENVDNIKTAFTASYGSGRPYIGILAEYDALSGLSQVGGATEFKPVVNGGCGHGCGHNMLGAGSLAAAIGVKAYLEKYKTSGTVILYGCPGEEGGASKAFMARDGLWYDLDAALTWHPEDCNEVVTGSTNSCIQVQYKFHGIASHASGSPELGRSALDAVELMNIGVQFLREHMSERARIHYAITDTGGCSPNVVQANASVLYMVRSNHVSEAIELQKRVDKIAEGAALMTETSLERKFIDGLADTISNHTLEKILYENFSEIGVPHYTSDEKAFAEQIAKTYDSDNAIPGLASKFSNSIKSQVKEMLSKSDSKMNEFLIPLYQGDVFRAGSTDVGDVSWECPTAQIHVAAFPNGTPGHSWQNVSCGKTSIGQKSVIYAGKILASTVIDLFTKPEILQAAKEEFLQASESGFVSPIPADAVPVIPD